MPLIVIYFLHSTSVLSFYIDVVLTLSNEMNQPVDICDSVHWTFYTRFRKMDYVQIIAYSMNFVYSTSIRLSIFEQIPGYKYVLCFQKCYLLMGNFYKALCQWKKLNYSL